MMESRQTGDTGRHYIVTADGASPQHIYVLKQDECFAIFNEIGDIDTAARAEEGLYFDGTRFLSRWTLLLAGHRPLLLGSGVRRDNLLLTVDLTNPDLYADGRLVLPRGALHVNRSKWLWQGRCYERLSVRNFSSTRFVLELAMGFAADYVDVFEVRGERRARRGEQQPPRLEPAALELAYIGLDRVERRTYLRCTPSPLATDAHGMQFRFNLASHATQTLELTVACCSGTTLPPLEAAPTHAEAFVRAENALQRRQVLEARISTSNEQFNAWLRASTADLAMMLTATPHGLYPFAGVPWFDAPFGRDGIITALETLWLWPGVARDVLAFLAHTQAEAHDPDRDAEPGKILHEARGGEMAALGEIPFGRYYGSVDSTPLFVLLAGAYFRRTADLGFIESIWPRLEAALEWIERYGDLDSDGFVEYSRHSPDGLVQQGWKDSQDSVFRADGALADPPIALCEVQGYVYAAWRGVADIAAALGHQALAARLLEAAAALRQRFEVQFWCEELQAYALALDGRKAPCCVLTSNPGHCLFTGIATQERARRMIAHFGNKRFFSGWGVRTVAEGQPRYNPMGYHNGSIWPHDNALLAAGAARYGSKALAVRILDALFDAATFFDQHRLPELFCGFRRRPGEGPTAYPVACAPQAWACGAVFLLLAACLGIRIDAARRQVVLRHPMLPRGLDTITIEGLQVGEGSVDLRVHRYPATVGVDLRRRSRNVEVIVQS